MGYGIMRKKSNDKYVANNVFVFCFGLKYAASYVGTMNDLLLIISGEICLVCGFMINMESFLFFIMRLEKGKSEMKIA